MFTNKTMNGTLTRIIPEIIKWPLKTWNLINLQSQNTGWRDSNHFSKATDFKVAREIYIEVILNRFAFESDWEYNENTNSLRSLLSYSEIFVKIYEQVRLRIFLQIILITGFAGIPKHWIRQRSLLNSTRKENFKGKKLVLRLTRLKCCWFENNWYVAIYLLS